MIHRLKTRLKAILLTSQQYTKTDMLYLAKGGSWLSGGQVLGSLMSFLVAVVFAAKLTPENYGTYKYAIAVLGLLGMAALPNMGTAIIQAVAAGKEAILKSAIRAKMCWGISGTIIGCAWSSYHFLHGNAGLATGILIVSLAIPLFGTYGVYAAYLTGKKRFDTTVIYGTQLQMLQSVSLISAAFVSGNIFVLLIVFFLSTIIGEIIFYRRTIFRWPPNGIPDDGVVPYGKHLSLINIIPGIAGQLDKFLVFHFLGASQLAVYAIAIAFPDQFKAFFVKIDTLMMPKFSARDSGEIRAGMMRKVFFLAIITTVGVGAYILAAPFLYGFFFPQYRESVFYSQVFALSMLSFPLYPAVVFLRAKKKVKAWFKGNLLSSIFNIVILVAGLLLGGLLGLIIARIIARIIGGCIMFILYLRSDDALAPSETSSLASVDLETPLQ